MHCEPPTSGGLEKSCTRQFSTYTHTMHHVSSMYASHVQLTWTFRHSKPWTVYSYDNTQPNEALLGSFVPRCFLGAAFSLAKDLAIDFGADAPDRGGDRSLGHAIVIHPLDLAPRFLKLLVEQGQVARCRGRARRVRVMV